MSGISTQSGMFRSRLWDPSQLSPSLWLDSQNVGPDTIITFPSSTVAQWGDISGNGNHLSQPNSLLRPDSYAFFQGPNSYVDFINGKQLFNSTPNGMLNTNGKSSIFFVKDLINPVSSTQDFIQFFSNDSTDIGVLSRRPRLFYRRVAGSMRGTTANGVGPDVPMNTTFLSPPDFFYTTIGTAVCSYIMRSSFDELNISIANGSNTPVNLLPTTTSNSIKIGDINTQNINLRFREVIFFPDEISLDNRLRIEGYLSHKWNVTSNLIPTHPYKNTPP